MADAIGPQVLDDLPHVLDAPLLAGVNRDAEPSLARLLHQPCVRAIREVWVGRASDVDADDAALPVAERLLDDDGVDLQREGAIHHQNQPGAHLRIFQQRAVLPANGGGDDVVEVLLALAVTLHRVEAQLQRGDVAAGDRPRR